jgi:hypothetical protein
MIPGMIPGVARHPAKKLEASEVLRLSLRHRWREEAIKAGRTVARITVAVEAGRDGFWPAPHGSSPWAEGSRLRARGVEAHVIMPPASRSHASIAARRPTVWTPRCCNERFSAHSTVGRIYA